MKDGTKHFVLTVKIPVTSIKQPAYIPYCFGRVELPVELNLFLTPVARLVSDGKNFSS